MWVLVAASVVTGFVVSPFEFVEGFFASREEKRHKLSMKRVARWGIPVVLVSVVVAYGLISYLIASALTSVDRKVQEDHPSAHDLRFEEVEFVSRKGDVNLRGWYLPGEEAKPTLIFVHGLGSIRTGDNAMALAARLVSPGYNVLLFDLRAHGSSDGDKVSGGVHEQQDVLGAFDFLLGQGIPGDSIGLLGFSMGAVTALLAASQEPAIHAVVADSTYSNASDLMARETARKTIFPLWLASIFVPTAKLMADKLHGIDVGTLVPEEAVKALSYPILVIHGEGDTRIPSDHGQKVYDAAPQGSSIWLVPDVDHVDAFLTHPDEYVNRIMVYYEARLGGR